MNGHVIGMIEQNIEQKQLFFPMFFPKLPADVCSPILREVKFHHENMLCSEGARVNVKEVFRSVPGDV